MIFSVLRWKFGLLSDPHGIGRVWGLCGDYQREMAGEFLRGDIRGGRVNYEKVNMLRLKSSLPYPAIPI